MRWPLRITRCSQCNRTACASASSSDDDKSGKKHAVLPVRADEPQVQAGYEVSRALFGSGGNARRFWVR